MISSTVGGSGGYRRPLLRGGRPWWKLEWVAGERRRPARSTSGDGFHGVLLWKMVDATIVLAQLPAAAAIRA